MIAIWFAVKAALAALSQFAIFLGAGAAIGAAASILRPWLGILGNAAMGAIAVGVAVLSGWAADDSDRVRALQAENERLERKATELRLTQAALRETLAALGDAAAHNEKVMTDLRSKLDSIPDCTIPEDVTDELRKIQ